MPITVPAPVAASERSARAIWLVSAVQVVHHEAQKFTTTTPPRHLVSEAVSPAVPSSTGSGRVASGAGGVLPARIAASSALLAPCVVSPNTSSATSAAPSTTEIDG